MEEYLGLVRNELEAGGKLRSLAAETMAEVIVKAAVMMAESLGKGGKILLIGNGGSAADAQHLACELVGRFKENRKPLAAIALTTDTSILTAVSNDFGYETLFVRQIEALANKNDMVIAISTSGTSPNIIKGVETAKERGCRVIGLTGASGGTLAGIADLCLKVPSDRTPQIQEMHIAIGHLLCHIVEQKVKKS